MRLTIFLLVLALGSAAVIPFDNAAVDQIFQQKNAALFLFLSDQAAAASALEAFTAYSQTNPPLILSLSTSNDGFGYFERLADHLGVKAGSGPEVIYLASGLDKYRYDGDEITAEGLQSFVDRAARGEVRLHLKSAPAPATNDQPVKVIVGSTFDDLVLDSEKEVLVEFYAPWCGHCKQLAPHFEEAARLLASNANVVLAKVDSTENEIEGVDIQGFPTVKFYRKDKSATPLSFNGERTALGIVQWIKEHTEYEWAEPAALDDEL